MKIVDQATGKEIPRAEGEPEEQFSSRPPRRDRGDRRRPAEAPRAELSPARGAIGSEPHDKGRPQRPFVCGLQEHADARRE